MKILVEHIVYQPYTGKITGGTERFTYLALAALRLAGHQAETVVPADSIECDRIRSPKPSKLVKGGDLRPWYAFLAEVGRGYDAILLNHPLDSPVPLSMPLPILRKCTYINHIASAAYVSSSMGMRLIGHLKALRHVGGHTLYLSEQNKADLEAQWAKQDDVAYGLSRYSEAGRRCTGDVSFLEHGLFDGRIDQAICPDDLAAPTASDGYLVSIGRADVGKRLELGSKVAKQLGKPHIVFTTTPDIKGQTIIAKLQEDGSEVFVDVPHDQIMAALAAADALLLPSKAKTYSHVAMEAVAHGVPVMALIAPPAMDDFPELLLPWDEPFVTTSLEERVGIQQFVQEEYSLLALSDRLQVALRL